MRRDPHSWNDDAQAETESLDWRARVDFPSRTIAAEATLNLRAPSSGPLDLDTRDLAIDEVTTGNIPLPFSLGAADPILGTRLRVELPPGTRALTIRYRTSPSASALQWLAPEQTLGGRHPFLFSQCQAIHARSVVPLQDTPRLRIRFTAELEVPRELRGLMAAAFVERVERGAVAVEKWRMPQPIPPYLFALAVGELQSRDVGPRSRVWAEPALVERAAWEFARTDEMLTVGERLFGPYDWERFDVLAMPPSFPYGGMENPRLTFVTPTLIAGDRSLDNVLAHELSHSWTGNLVTNSSAEHFWLNEGFTVFAERRILAALSGDEQTALHAALGRRALDRALQRFDKRPELQRLHQPLDGVDPDEAFSEVPYEKGYLFLRAIEEAVGSARFDGFLRKYIDEFRFRSIDSDDFCRLVERELPGALDRVDARAWLDGAGVPPSAPAPRSRLLAEIEALRGALPDEAQARRWSPTEWQLYLELQPLPSPRALVDELDGKWRLTDSGNWEVLVAWLVLAVGSGRDEALARLERALGEVGRMKYLKPLYGALDRDEKTRRMGVEAFARLRARYHPIAQAVVQRVIDDYKR